MSLLPRVAVRAAALALVALGAGCATQPPTPDPAADAVSRRLADRFQQQLLAALTKSLADGGPVAAIGTCSVEAPRIAAALAAESGAEVTRVALKTRNPAAVPVAVERPLVEALRAAPLSASGQPSERSGWTGSGAARRYRYLRAIPTGPLCLGCHGAAIAPDLRAAILARYPQDQATGFAPGELRGAFAIRWSPQALARALASGPGSP